MLNVRIFLNEKAVKISHYMFTLKNKNRQTSKKREGVRKGDSSVCAGGPIYTMSLSCFIAVKSTHEIQWRL